MKKISVLSVLFMCVATLALSSSAFAPGFPITYSGTIQVDGKDATVGTLIDVRFDSTSKEIVDISHEGNYTTGQLSGNGGEEVTFYIKTPSMDDYIKAQENTIYDPDAFEETINLTTIQDSDVPVITEVRPMSLGYSNEDIIEIQDIGTCSDEGYGMHKTQPYRVTYAASDSKTSCGLGLEYTDGPWDISNDLKIESPEDGKYYCVRLECQDAVGNIRTGYSSGNILYDTESPSVSISSSTPNPTNGLIEVLAKFNEPINNFEQEDITVVNGTISNGIFSDCSTEYTFEVNPTGEKVTINISGGVTTDLASNKNIVSNTLEYTYDDLEPTLSICLDDYALNAGETTTVNFTFSERPVSFSSADISAGNGNISNLISTDDTEYKATFIPSKDTESSDNIITVGTDWTDTAGNFPAAQTESKEYIIDTLRPILNITLSDKSLILGEKGLVTFNFSERTEDFGLDDIYAENGNISNLISTDDTEYKATLTPSENAESSDNIITVGTNWTDSAGNNPSVDSDFEDYTIDTIMPEASVTMISDNQNSALAKVGDNVTLTINASEPLQEPYVKILGKNVSVEVIDSDSRWSSSYKLTKNDTEGELNISIEYMDIAGNTVSMINKTTDNSTVVFDRTPPTLNISLGSYSLDLGGKTTVTFRFSEAPLNFSSEDIYAGHGTISDLENTSMTTYTATFTAGSNEMSDINMTVDVNWTDLAGNRPSANITSENYNIVKPVTTTSNDRGSSHRRSGGGGSITIITCGDGICSTSENETSCPQDCAEQQDNATNQTYNSTAAQKGNADEIKDMESPCSEKWVCEEWSACIDGMRTRTCTDVNNCGTGLQRPSFTESCQPEDNSTSEKDSQFTPTGFATMNPSGSISDFFSSLSIGIPGFIGNAFATVGGILGSLFSF